MQSANTVIQRYVAGMVLSSCNVSLLPLQLTHVVLLLFFQSTNFQCMNVGGSGGQLKSLVCFGQSAKTGLGLHESGWQLLCSCREESHLLLLPQPDGW